MAASLTYTQSALSAQFEIKIGTLLITRVMTVGGLSSSVEATSFNDGTDWVARKRPGLPSFDDITIKRGFHYDDKDVSDYWETWLKHTGVHEDGSIMLHNNGGAGKDEIVAQWDFFGAFPIKYALSDFDASSSDMVTEELTITIETLTRVK